MFSYYVEENILVFGFLGEISHLAESISKYQAYWLYRGYIVVVRRQTVFHSFKILHK